MLSDAMHRIREAENQKWGDLHVKHRISLGWESFRCMHEGSSCPEKNTTHKSKKVQKSSSLEAVCLKKNELYDLTILLCRTFL